MSLHCCVVAIEGDWIDEISGVFEKLKYRVDESFIAQTWEQVRVELNRHRLDSRKTAMAVYVVNGWTHIVDLMCGLYFEDVWQEYSGLWNTRVFGWVCEGCSGSYGFMLHHAGQRLRDVLTSEGKIETDTGEAIMEEEGIDWISADEEEVLLLADRMGLDHGTPERGYLVFRLDWRERAPSPESLAKLVEAYQLAPTPPRERWFGMTPSPRWQWTLLWTILAILAISTLFTIDWGFWLKKLRP
jgi:hypothetical protein